MSNELLATIVAYIPVQLSLSVHEWAHARVAYALGDDTAARQGRLTLNPIVHMDLLGTIIPLMGIPFGWAKPVPVNPANFRQGVSMRTGMMLTSAAGPLSNIALAVVACLTLALLARATPSALTESGGLLALLERAVIVNLALAAFNLLPIHPLDGSRILGGLVPFAWQNGWERFTQIGPILLMVILVLPSDRFNLFGWIYSAGSWMLELALG